MFNNKPGQAETHNNNNNSSNKMQLHALHTFGLMLLVVGPQVARQPQKAQRFIRFALLLSVKLFRKLPQATTTAENAK